MRNWNRLLMLICLLLLLPVVSVQAEETEAVNISGKELVVDANRVNKDRIFDGDQVNSQRLVSESYVTLQHEEGIGSVYLLFNLEYGDYTITNEDTGETVTCGQYRYLHDFVDLTALFGSAPSKVTIAFHQETGQFNELYVFTEGKVPDWVQIWQQPVDNETDLVLFSTHCDDEQLFFAGVLPYYAGELEYQVQVVYLTISRNHSTRRAHEMLDGLWTVGVRSYPVYSEFGDYKAPTMDKAYSIYKYMGVEEDQLLAYVVENIRRFKPKVVVGHDIINGEYGHGAHILYADLLVKALEISNDPEQYPESAEKYGVWDLPKTYLHLYPENEIVMDWDQPLSKFGGLTAYQVTKELGFPCHVSQVNGFLWYMAGADTAKEVQKYSPCEYGLYRSTVGPDVEKNDFFENMTTYAQDKAVAEEAARLAQEEARRAEEEAKLAEEAQRQTEAEEAARLEREKALLQLQEAQLQERKMRLFGGLGTILLVLTAVLLVVLKKKK